MEERAEDNSSSPHIERPHTIPSFVPPNEKSLGPIICTCENISKSYALANRKDPVVALKEISIVDGSEFFPIHQGEFVMIRGPSGGGKTTLLNILGTIDKPSTGSLMLFGNKIDNQSKDSYLSRLRLEKIGFVFQTFNLLATLSAYENVQLPMTLLNVPKKESHDRACELLRLVGLRDRMGHLPSELSGGEQQRVTIARALANHPELLLLDEPTGDLDTRNTIEIMDLILDINRKGTTCIMVTHNPDIECYADRILYVKDGRFDCQALNARQTPLVYSDYVRYLNIEEGSF